MMMMRLGIRIRCHSSTSSSMIIRNMSHHGNRTVPTLLFVQSLQQQQQQQQQQPQRVPSVRTRTTLFSSSSSSSSTSSYRRKSNYPNALRQQQPQSPSRHIPMWNGKPIPFHINDLQHLPSSSSSLLLHHQQYQHYYGNNISSSSSSSASLQSLDDDDDDDTEPIRSDDDDEDKNQNDDDRLIVVLDLDECLIHSHFSNSSMDAALFTHQLQQQQHRMKHSQSSQSSFDSFRIVLPNHNENNPLPSHFSHRNDYYQQQSQLPQYNSNDNHSSNTHVHVFIRPGCLEFLAQVTQLYPTYIYTAARSIYANPILDHLSHAVRTIQQQQQLEQPTPLDTSTSTTTTSATTKTANTTTTTTTNTKKCIFQGRFYREHCIYDLKTNQYYKDLTQLHRHNRYCTISSQTHKMVLIDNNPISLMKNPHNGILVDSFYGPFTTSSSPISSSTTNVVDSTFTNVFQLLQELSILPDVRPKIAANQKLHLQQLQQPSSTDIVPTTTNITPTSTSTSTTATSATSAITTTTTSTKKASVMPEDIPSAISYIHI